MLIWVEEYNPLGVCLFLQHLKDGFHSTMQSVFALIKLAATRQRNVTLTVFSIVG